MQLTVQFSAKEVRMGGMSTQPLDTGAFAQFAAAMDVAAGVARKFNEQIAAQSKRIGWDLQIAFANTDRDRRRIRRDRARAYRRPAIIHKGGKP